RPRAEEPPGGQSVTWRLAGRFAESAFPSVPGETYGSSCLTDVTLICLWKHGNLPSYASIRHPTWRVAKKGEGRWALCIDEDVEMESTAQYSGSSTTSTVDR